MDQVVAWAEALAGSPWIFLVVYAFATIDGFFPPIPSESIVISLATLSMSVGKPSLWVLVPVAAAGAFTGDQIAYFIGSKVKVRELRLFRGKKAQGALDWAEGALERRGASFIIAARYIPVGRVAVNMTAGAVGYSHRRFTGLAAIAAVMWAVYSAAIGVGTGAWLHDHPLIAVVVGVVGGVLIGLVVDWALRTWLHPARREADEGPGATESTPEPTSEPTAAPTTVPHRPRDDR